MGVQTWLSDREGEEEEQEREEEEEEVVGAVEYREKMMVRAFE